MCVCQVWICTICVCRWNRENVCEMVVERVFLIILNFVTLLPLYDCVSEYFLNGRQLTRAYIELKSMEHAIGRKRVDPRWRDESEKSEADEKWMDGKVHSMGKESERERKEERREETKNGSVGITNKQIQYLFHVFPIKSQANTSLTLLSLSLSLCRCSFKLHRNTALVLFYYSWNDSATRFMYKCHKCVMVLHE